MYADEDAEQRQAHAEGEIQHEQQAQQAIVRPPVNHTPTSDKRLFRGGRAPNTLPRARRVQMTDQRKRHISQDHLGHVLKK